MSDKYKAIVPDTAYFITITTVGWIDVFTRLRQKMALIDSLIYCQKNKGLKIYAYCIMSNHLHMLCEAPKGESLYNTVRDFKKFTSKQIIKNIIEYPESRRHWMLSYFKNSCSHLARDQQYKVWQNGYHAEYATSKWFIRQKIYYIHNNPVKARIVERPTDYVFSSAKNYASLAGILDVEVIQLARI